MKDPLVIAGLGFFVYGFYFLLIKPNGRIIRNIGLILIGFYLMRYIKTYVVASILPATILWYFLMLQDRIRNKLFKRLAWPVFLIIGGGGAFAAIQQLGSSFAAASLEGFLEEAEKITTQDGRALRAKGHRSHKSAALPFRALGPLCKEAYEMGISHKSLLNAPKCAQEPK